MLGHVVTDIYQLESYPRALVVCSNNLSKTVHWTCSLSLSSSVSTPTPWCRGYTSLLRAMPSLANDLLCSFDRDPVPLLSIYLVSCSRRWKQLITVDWHDGIDCAPFYPSFNVPLWNAYRLQRALGARFIGPFPTDSMVTMSEGEDNKSMWARYWRGGLYHRCCTAFNINTRPWLY